MRDRSGRQRPAAWSAGSAADRAHRGGGWLLETGINGGGSVDLQAVYRDGAAQDIPMYFQANCSPQGTQVPQYLIYAAPYYLTPTGVTTSYRYLYADAVPVDARHTLTGLVLPARGAVANKYVVMALTLQQAPSAS